MRALFSLLLTSGIALAQLSFAQSSDTTKPADPAPPSPAARQTTSPAHGTITEVRDPNVLVIPTGSKVPLSLAQAISTKNAREGDAVYAQTVFPFVLNERVLIPAGTYIQGKISHTVQAGRAGDKRAEILIHFTTMIYPTGYTIMLPASVENTPGADNNGVKDSEGTIQQDKDTGKRVEDAAKGAAVGGTVGTIGGAAAGGLNGARIGGLAGLAGGVAWALLKHGPEVKLPVGTSIEMEVQRDITVDASRIQVAKAGS